MKNIEEEKGWVCCAYKNPSYRWPCGHKKRAKALRSRIAWKNIRNAQEIRVEKKPNEVCDRKQFQEPFHNVSYSTVLLTFASGFGTILCLSTLSENSLLDDVMKADIHQMQRKEC